MPTILPPLLAIVAVLGPCQSAPTAADEKAVRAVLDDQVAAWNKGDLDGFMRGYWKDEKLTFISGGTITRGWVPTRERYVKRYQAEGKDKMGTLSFDELEVEGFGPDAAMVRGRFKLVRGDQTDTGRFTLLFRKIPDGWRIVHDHTSAAEKTAPEKK
jgi:beta-aspartyl-peptidase (threonine type)